MPYCPRCGVEADPSVRTCPLCATPLPAFADLGPGEPAWPTPDALSPAANPSQAFASRGERKRRAFWAVAAVFATAALAVAAADLFTSGHFSWSRWPLASLAAVFGLTAAVFAWPRRPRRWAGAWVLITVAFLGALDLADPGPRPWFLALGLPLTLVTWGLIFGGGEAVRRSRRRGYDVPGLAALLVAAELAAVDLVVTLWVTGAPGLGWSLVAALVLVPLAFLFFFLHYALGRTPDFRRTFHF